MMEYQQECPVVVETQWNQNWDQPNLYFTDDYDWCYYYNSNGYRGDVSYGQTEYLSQKAVMSFNPVSDSSVKFNNGEPAVKLQNYSLQQQQHQQQQQQQHQQPPQQHYYYGGTVGGVGGNGDSGMDSHHHHHHHHNQQQQQQENLQQSQPTPIQIEPLAQGSLQSDHPHMMLVDSGRGNNNTTEHAQVHGFGSQSTHQGQEGQHQQVERREYSVPSSMMGPQHQQDFGGHKTGSRSYMYDNGEGRSPADFEFKKETPIGGGTTLKIPRYSLSYASTISVPAPIDMKSNYPVLPPFMHEKEPDIGVNRKSVGGDGGPRTPGYGVPTPEGRNGGENADAEKQFDPYDPRSERNTYDSRPGSAPYNSRPGSHGSHTSLYSGDVYSKSRAGDDMMRRDSVSMETTPTVTPTTSSGQPQEVTNVDAELAPSVVPEVMSEKNGSSPMRLGDDQPATHSDSGIVHDGGSNTSSNSSGDQDDSAAMLKSHSTGSNGDNSFRYDMPPTSLADPHRRIGESGALSSPFLTPSASTSHNITPNSDVTSKEEDRLPGDVTNSNSSNKHSGGGFISSGPAQFPSPLSAPSGDESSGTPERRPLSVPHVPHPLTPSISSMGSAFLSPGSGMGLSPSPRNPLTPSSTRSASPDPLPPNMFDGNKDVYFCHLCSYVGTSQFHFKQHMDTHFEHRCPHCDYTSRTEGRLKRHIKDFHSDVPPENYSGNRTPRNTTPKPKVYKCKQCEFQTMNRVEFWEHSRTHIKEDKVLQCPKCPFVTEYKHHLEYHLRNHFGSKPFKCPKCNYACVNKSMLNSHMKSHTNVYQYRCADCTYATKYCHSLKLHLKKYNHKPATVLNADGSLPIDGSGDFELVSKRGPPRGPRGPRKGERQEQPMNPINHMGLMPQMTGMNGMPPPGMMPGYWPMMPPMPNGGLHPPPPLIPVSGSPFNPNLPMPISLQAPLQQEHHMMMQRHHHLQQQQHLQHHGEKGGEKEPHLPGDRPSNTVPGSHTRIKCVICDYTTDNRPSLNEHMLKVHAKENQDLLNMFGVQHDTFSEDPSLAAAAAVAAAAALSRPHSRTDSTSKPEVSETAATPIKQEICSQSQSPPPANQAWIMNASQPGARRSTPGDMFPSPMFRSTPQGAVPPSPQSMDILQQQLLKERYNAAIAAEIATNIEAEAKQNGECPLDLTKRKEQMQHLAASHMFFNQGFMFSQMQKRKFDEVSMVAMAAVNAASQHGPYPPGLRSSPPVQDNNNSATPRKRSRKGKAYKLDTICQKLQERYGDSPPPDGHGSNDEDTSDSINSGMHDQLAARGGDGELENEQIDYSAIHSSLSELNNQMAVDAFRGDPHTGEDKGLHEAGNDNHTEEVSSATSGITFSGSINRRKLFMVRHNTDNKNEQQGSVDGGEDSEMNGQGASRSQPVPHGEEEDDDEPVRMTVAQSTPLTTNAAPTEAASSTSLPYECSHCAIAFRDCVMYTVHMGYHGYQDPFKCNMCGLVSQNSVEFFLHIARVAHE